MNCKKCGACCIAISISSPIPGMSSGKPAGTRCVHLGTDNTCAIYETRPPVCRNYSPADDLCGNSFEDAMSRLMILERGTE